MSAAFVIGRSHLYPHRAHEIRLRVLFPHQMRHLQLNSLIFSFFCISVMIVSARVAPIVKCPTSYKCPVGYHCEMQTVQCIRAPCPQQPTCVQDPCPYAVKCATMCPNGYVYDAKNCQTCVCQSCQDTVCPPGQVCQQVECLAAPCYPVCQTPDA